MTVTIGELINGMLRLTGQLAEGETPSADTAQNALFAINQMIDSWNTERLSVFCTNDQSFVWPPNEISRTLGPTGDFIGNRPILLDDSTYFTDSSNNLSFPVKFINEDQYNAIALKTVTSTYPQVIFVNNTFPDITLKIYPKPNKPLTWHFISVTELTQPATLATVLHFPPGYLRAFRFNGACEIANEFGVEPSQQTKRIAMISKRNLKRINNPDYVLGLPYPLISTHRRYNIFTNNFS